MSETTRLARAARRPGAVAFVLAAVLVLTGCGGGSPDAPAGPAEHAMAETAVPEPLETTVERTVDEHEPIGDTVDPVVELDLEDVVAAALLVASGGDLDAAIAAGLIGEAEADAALDALERGSLDEVLGR